MLLGCWVRVAVWAPWGVKFTNLKIRKEKGSPRWMLPRLRVRVALWAPVGGRFTNLKIRNEKRCPHTMLVRLGSDC